MTTENERAEALKRTLEEARGIALEIEQAIDRIVARSADFRENMRAAEASAEYAANHSMEGEAAAARMRDNAIEASANLPNPSRRI